MPIDHDPFAGRYYRQEPVAFALVASEKQIDWSRRAIPEETLWIPEVLVSEILGAARAGTLLSQLRGRPVIVQQRFSPAESAQLKRELVHIEPDLTEDARTAVTHICELLKVHQATSSGVLLVEGP